MSESAAQILPTAEENYAAIKVLADYVAQLLQITLPNGIPAVAEAGETTAVAVSILEVNASLDPTSPRLHYRIGASGAFSESSLTPLGGAMYEATLPAASCGQTIQFYVSAETDGGALVTSPADAPAAVYEIAGAGSITTRSFAPLPLRT